VLTDLGKDVQIVEADGIDGAAEAVERPGDFTIALIDPTDGQADRFDRLRAIGERLAPTPLVVIAPEEDRREAVYALQNGASGYLPKSLPVDVLLGALRLVLAGGIYAPPKLLLGTVTGSPGVRRVEVNGPTGLGGTLTERQRDVLAYLGQGKSNKEIATEL
jgi:DNA-binding NarL/FixJ family response regulator